MRYYPVEMIAAMLNSVMGVNEKVAGYIKFAESQGIQVVSPDINKSFSKFTVEGDKIIFGLAAIRNVGVNVVDAIIKAREQKGEFTSIMDFINKLELGAINKRAVESLIKAGALDCFHIFRSKQLAVYEKLMDGVSGEKKRNIDGQISLFTIDEEVTMPEVTYPNIREFIKKHLLSMEKEMTGVYLSGHPLDEYKKSLEMQTTTSVSTINKVHKALEDNISKGISIDEIVDQMPIKDNEQVILGGILTEVKQKVTRNNTIMAFLKLEDLGGEIEVIVFPKTLDRVRESIAEDALVTIKGRINLKEDEPPKLICEKVDGLEKVDSNKVYIKVNDKEEMKKVNTDFKTEFTDYKGDSAVYVFNAKDKKSYRLARESWVNLDSDIVSVLKEKYGEDNIKVISK
ncbi:MAG: OB-fold nucleic acid binding domain-containing protein, partial [Clostridium sp.]|uniref:helix-hairpin-helix domain-containing protein n=1 Tax=Clostridium sp. TaxID=1506 RepID=UPI002FCBC37D